jgi:hypothetical protein
MPDKGEHSMAIYNEYFVNNKYLKWYSLIIESAKTRSKNKYTESHHIIPKCMGGSNKKDNLVRLTYREHFLCHWLLTKFVFHKKYNKKLLHALTFMVGDNGLGDKRFSSWQYEIAKKAAKNSMMGEKNNFFGKKHTKETSEKMSAGQKRHNEIYGRKPHTEEFKKRSSEMRKGKPAPESTKIARKKFFKENNVRWYNNGEISMMIIEGDPIPDGFIRGRNIIKETLSGLVYYNNGVINRRFRKGDIIPENFIVGQLRSKKVSYIWYNNGEVQICISSEEKCPPGFVKGRIRGKIKMGKWYNNGKVSKRFNDMNTIPDDFLPGRLEISKNKNKQ